MTILKFIRAAVLIFLCSMLFACSGGSGSSGSNSSVESPGTSSASGTDSGGGSSTSVTTLRISPSSAEVADGLSEAFTATITYADGESSVLTSGVVWNSSNLSVASINDNGLATVKAEGGADEITATYEGVTSAPAVLTATSAALESVSVSPLTATIAKGLTEQYTAKAHYSDGTSSILTSGVVWTSNNLNVAAIDSNGLATVKASSGTTDITATYDNVTSTTPAVLTATAAKLESLSVSPLTATIAKGLTEKYAATGTYSDGSTSPLTSGVTWTSSNTNTATIDSTGFATVKAASGTSNITATYNDITSATPAVLTATSAALESVSVSPLSATIAKGLTEQYAATGTYSDGSTSRLTSGVTWKSSDATVASLGGAGLATVNAASGTTDITATYEGVTSVTPAVLTATAATLKSVSISPLSATIAKGLTEQYTATGTYSDGSTSILTSQVTWKSSDTSVASIDNTGLATVAAASGSTKIAATYKDITSATPGVLTASAAILQSISVSPTSATVGKGLTEQYSAVGTYSDGSTSSLTSGVTWKSSDTSVASIDSTGLATSEAVSGTSVITANYNGVTSTTDAVFTATTAALESVSVSPLTAAVTQGSTEQYSATGTYSDGSTSPLTSDVTWTSSSPSVASIDDTGLATVAASSGRTDITATYRGVTSTTPGLLTANAATLQSVTVTPATATVGKGLTKQYTAIGTYSNQTTVPLTSGVTWKSSNTSVATIDSNGLATSDATSGTSDITASYDGVTSSAAVLTATAPQLSSITVNPANASVPTDSTQQFTAVAYYSDGSSQVITTGVTWMSSRPAVATINSSGLATAIGYEYTSKITATYDGVTSSAAIFTATNPVLQSITLSPTSYTFPLLICDQPAKQFTATGYYSNGKSEDLTYNVTWSVGNTNIITVNDIGQVTKGCTQSGVTYVEASADGVSGKATVTNLTD